MNIDFFNIAGRILRISHSIVLQTPRSLQPKCGVKRLRLTTKTGRLGASPPTDSPFQSVVKEIIIYEYCVISGLIKRFEYSEQRK